MTHQGDAFSRLPPEIIQHIAVTTCGLTLAGPPAELATMLRICRSVHAALCIQLNPALHARIFSVKFDSRAPTRRFADAGKPLTAFNLAHELQRRWAALKRIQDVSTKEALLVCSEEQVLENLWLIYLMFLESDGRNLAQLYWARVARYLRTILQEKFLTSTDTGYLAESTTRTLGLWLMWYLTDVYVVIEEDPSGAALLRAMLRPWALALHKYDILSAPYTHWTLPTPEAPDLDEDPAAETPLFPADLKLRNRAEVVMHMGHRIQLAPPRASIAAIMAFMVRIERNGPISVHRTHPTPNPLDQQPPLDHPGLAIYPRTRYPAFKGPGTMEFDGRVNRTGSIVYDLEWRRALQCGNPFATPEIKVMPMFKPGELVGRWEGRFVYPTLDTFRGMLVGGIEAIANAHIVQIAGSWNIQEHHLVSRRRRFGCQSDFVDGEKLPIGRVLNAYIPTSAEFIHHNRPYEPGNKRLEVRVSDSASPLGYKSYHYTTLDRPADLPPTRIQINTVIPATHPPDTDLPPDWDAPQPPSLGDGDYEFDEEILDTLITGEGHSAWGSFTLRGKIRAWDGLIIILKDYHDQASGRWLYKGHVSGGNWVGRWRDTFTSEQMNGYEGVFSVTRQY